MRMTPARNPPMCANHATPDVPDYPVFPIPQSPQINKKLSVLRVWYDAIFSINRIFLYLIILQVISFEPEV
jgi:hypothetical protein